MVSSHGYTISGKEYGEGAIMVCGKYGAGEGEMGGSNGGEIIMDEPIEVIEHEGLIVKILPDTDAQSPGDWGDNGAFLVHYHRDFWQENKDILAEDDLRDIYVGEKTEKTKELKRDYHIFPVAAYIHSGVCLSLGHAFAEDSGGWDTSHVGAVFCSKAEWKSKKKAENYAEGLIKQWNQYLGGEVYGYVVENKDGDRLDSCWGFYGLDDCIAEGKSVAEHHAKELKKKREAKLKALVKARAPLEKRKEVLA